MGELVGIVDSLENLVGKMLHKLDLLDQVNVKLKNELSILEKENQKIKETAHQWEEKYNALKLANSMLGSNKTKTEAKLKINTLIRNLDHCISQLAE